MDSWSGFWLGLGVAVLVNFVTSLFSRERALNLIPWLAFYVTVHLFWVFLNTATVRIKMMKIATTAHHSFLSYIVVILLGATLAALYWRVLNISVDALAAITQPSLSSNPQGSSKKPSEENKNNDGNKDANMKKDDQPTKSTVLTQNAPGGINIGGDNLGSAIVNNFGPTLPKPLVLDKNQATHVSESLKSFSGQSAEIFLVGDRSETQPFGVQLKKAMEVAGIHVTISTAGVLARENGAGPPPPGVSISVADNRLDIANALGVALIQQLVIDKPLGGIKSLKANTFVVYIAPLK